MSLELAAVTPMLKTKDLGETIAFYTKQLGFSVANQMEGDDGRPSWCCLRSGDVEVMFYSAAGLNEPPGVPTMTGVLYFNPKDVRAAWAQLKDSGKVEWELQEMPYGMLEFAIRDCNGYILSFGQEIERRQSEGVGD